MDIHIYRLYQQATRVMDKSIHLSRLYQQTARVMDKSLLNIQNLHDVKHWIEPSKLF